MEKEKVGEARELLTALAIGHSPRIGDWICINRFRENTEFENATCHYTEQCLREWMLQPVQGLNGNIIGIEWTRPDSFFMLIPVGATMWVWPDDVTFL